MREILFKAKRVDNGEWVEGIPIQTHIEMMGGFRQKSRLKSLVNLFLLN